VLVQLDQGQGQGQGRGQVAAAAGGGVVGGQFDEAVGLVAEVGEQRHAREAGGRRARHGEAP
jgi:hypothetical protein